MWFSFGENRSLVGFRNSYGFLKNVFLVSLGDRLVIKIEYIFFFHQDLHTHDRFDIKLANTQELNQFSDDINYADFYSNQKRRISVFSISV